MARIIFGMLMSLDGFIAGPEGRPGLPVPDAALHEHFNEMIRQTSIALYGRRMYEVMRVWESHGEKGRVPEVAAAFAREWRKTPKVVFSSTLRTVGPNARLVKEDVEGTVKTLKRETQGDIMVAGAGLAANLSRHRLIDEYQLFLHPVVLGGGKPFFEAGNAMTLRLLDMQNLAQDVVLLRYGRD